MSDVRKASSGQAQKAKSSVNWPVLAAAAICIVFVIGVWVNNYRVSHATPTPAPITSTK